MVFAFQELLFTWTRTTTAPIRPYLLAESSASVVPKTHTGETTSNAPHLAICAPPHQSLSSLAQCLGACPDDSGARVGRARTMAHGNGRAHRCRYFRLSGLLHRNYGRQ